MWDCSVFTQYSYYRDFFCSGPESRFRGHHCHEWVRYIDTTIITVLRFVWDCSVFIQYSYYCDFFCLGPSLGLCNRHRHVWVRYIDTTKITVWCMSSLLLSIDLQWFCYFVIFYFKLSQNLSFLANIEFVHLFYFRTQTFRSRQINPQPSIFDH